MKLSRRQLRQIIKEEVSRLNEAYASPSDVAEEALSTFGTNEEKLVRLIVGSIQHDVHGTKDVHGALSKWVLNVYRAAGRTRHDGSFNIIMSITRAETKAEHINTIVRMFVDRHAGLTGPLSRPEGDDLRVGLSRIFGGVEF